MGALCNRCRVSGCLLNYMGQSCKGARQEKCPDVRRTRAEILQDMADPADMARALSQLMDRKDKIWGATPTAHELLKWLTEYPTGEDDLFEQSV